MKVRGGGGRFDPSRPWLVWLEGELLWCCPTKKGKVPRNRTHTHRVASMARRMRRAYLSEKGRHLNEATNRRHHRRHQPVMLHSLHMLNIIEFSHILMCCFSVALAVFVWVSYEGIDKIWNVLILKEFETIFEYRLIFILFLFFLFTTIYFNFHF